MSVLALPSKRILECKGTLLPKQFTTINSMLSTYSAYSTRWTFLNHVPNNVCKASFPHGTFLLGPSYRVHKCPRTWCLQMHLNFCLHELYIYELCEASSVILPTWVPHSWHNSLHDSFGSVIVAHAWWKLLAELSLSLPASSLSKRWIWHCIHWSNLSRGRTATWRSLAAERIEVRKSRNCFFD